MKISTSNNGRRLWLWVALCAATTIVLWATVFYPTSLKRSRPAEGQKFGEFQAKIKNAFSVFKKKAPEAKPKTPGPEIQDLRERVFGDSVERK